MAGNTTKYQRDMYGWDNLPLRNRVVPSIFQHVADAGDAYGGIQYMMLLSLSKYGPRTLLEGLTPSNLAASTLDVAAGYAMIDGEPVQLATGETGYSLSDGDYVYIKKTPGSESFQGELDTDAYASIASCTGFPIAWNNGGALVDLREMFSFMSHSYLGDISARGALAITGTLSVTGASTLTGEVTMEGGADMSGTDIAGAGDVECDTATVAEAVAVSSSNITIDIGNYEFPVMTIGGRLFKMSPSPWYGFSAGGVDGGSNNTIEYIDTTVIACNGTDRGNTSDSANAVGAGAVTGPVYGIIAALGGSYNGIDYFGIATLSGNSSAMGTLSVARYLAAGVGGDTYGFFGGGANLQDVIDYVAMSTLVQNATDSGDLTVARHALGGIAGSTYGFFLGGNSEAAVTTNTIDYITLSSATGNAIDKGDLTVARGAGACCSGPLYGFYCGGDTVGDGTDTNVIDYIDITTTSGNAADKGDTVAADWGHAGLASQVYGFITGGESSGDLIQYIDITTTSGNAADTTGNLTGNRYSAGGIGAA